MSSRALYWGSTTLGIRAVSCAGIRAVSCVLAFAACAFAMPYIVDDAFFYARYAERLLATGSVTWEPSMRPSQGFTSPLWQLLWLPAEYTGAGIWGMKVLGAALHAASVWGCLWMLQASRFGIGAPLAVQGVAGAVLAVAAPLAIPAVAGLETPLDVACALWIAMLLAGPAPVAASAGGRFVAGLLVGATAWVRPDLLIASGVGLAARLGLALQRKELRLAQLVPIAAGVAIPCLGWAAVALWLFDSVVPNSAYVKIVQHGPLPGLAAVRSVILCWLLPTALAVGMVAWAARRPLIRAEPPAGTRATTGAVVGGMLVGHLLFFTNVYPEMNFVHRFHARALPLAVLAAALVGSWLGGRLVVRRRPARWAAVGAVSLAATVILGQGRSDYEDSRQRGRDLLGAHYRLGGIVRDCAERNGAAERLVLLTHDSGATPYAWRHAAVDMGGLGTVEFARGELTLAEAVQRWNVLLVHRRVRSGPGTAAPGADVCGAFRVLGGLPYTSYAMYALAEATWLATPAGQQFAGCVEARLSLNGRILPGEACRSMRRPVRPG